EAGQRRVVQHLHLVSTPGLDDASALALLHDPRRQGGHLAQQVRLLARLEPEPLAQHLQLLVEHPVRQRLKSGHRALLVSKRLLTNNHTRKYRSAAVTSSTSRGQRPRRRRSRVRRVSRAAWPRRSG